MASKVTRAHLVFFMYLGFFLFYVLPAKADLSVELFFPASEQGIANHLEQIPESLFIESFTFESDISVFEGELKHLFNIKKGSLLLRQDIVRGISLLQKKNKFEKIELILTPNVSGYQLHLDLTGHWTFYKIKIHGFLLNKDRFGSYYLLEPGQKFVLEKHQESLERIKDIFKEDGYFSADIRERLVFDEKEKLVTVHLTIDRKAQFRIGEISVMAIAGNGVSSYEKEIFQQKLIRQLNSSFQNMYYTKNYLDQEIKSLKRYIRKKGYVRSGLKVMEGVDRRRQMVNLTFSLRIHRKKKFIFFGNHYFSDSDLHEKISLFGKAASQIPSSIIVAEVEDIYKKSGFLAAQVRAEEEDDRFIFIIQEGQRSCIGNIVLEGNEQIALEDLEKGVLAEFQKSYLDAETQKRIIDGVLNFYRSRGFWDVHVSVQDIVCQVGASYVVGLRIFEGDQRFFIGADVEQLPDSIDGFAFQKIDTPIPFDGTLIDQQRQALMLHLHKKGCLYAHVKPEFIEKKEGMRVLWHVIGDVQQVTFGKTVIIGNSRLQYEKIAREFAFKEGMAWDRDKLSRTVENLRKLGVFESVSLYPVDTAQPGVDKSLILQVIEGSPFEARVRIGYQHVSLIRGSTYKVGASLLAKNPTCNADSVRFDADMTRFYQSVVFAYERPWLFDQPIRSAMRGYIQTYEQPLYMGSRDILYTADHDGFCANFDKTFAYGDTGLSMGCDALRTRGLSPMIARAINFDPNLIGKRVVYMFIEPHVLIDLLDDSINPQRGALTTASFRASLSLNRPDLSLARAMVEQSFFFPVGQRTVGALRCRLGHVFHQEFNTIMPHDRFYLGGPHTLRSIEPNFAPPLGVFGQERVHVPIGGKTMFNINLEARVVIRGNLGGVVFQDIGALIAKRFLDITADDISAGTGFGLRYATPIGPIRFDLGIKWKKRFVGDCRTAWFLTVGHAF